MKKAIKNVLLCMIIVFLPAPAFLSPVAEPPRFRSFEFHNASVAEALQEISRDFDFTIYAPFDKLNEKVTKSYKDASFETIIRDMMWRRDHAIVWYYKNQKIVAVEIQLVKGEGKRDAFTHQNVNRTAMGRNSAPDRDPQTGDGYGRVFSDAGNRNVYASNRGATRGTDNIGRLSENDNLERSGRIESSGGRSDAGNTPAGQSRSGSEQSRGESSPPPSAPSARILPEGLEPPPSPPGM